MFRLNKTDIIIFLLSIFYIIGQLKSFSIIRDKRDAIDDLIDYEEPLNFDTNILPTAIERRTIACLFVFDKAASLSLNNSLTKAKRYATKLAKLTSKYTQHANIVVTNADVEMWTKDDRILFDPGNDPFSAMSNFATEFQTYLAKTQKKNFGAIYAAGILISGNVNATGGYAQGPPCTTSAVSVINFRPRPWSIARLVAHELAHILSVLHPMELLTLCPDFPNFSFCKNELTEECSCEKIPEKCIMTYYFRNLNGTAGKYTPCDIEMMNYFSSKIPCLIK